MATYAKNVGIFNNHFAANLRRNLTVKNVITRLRFDRIVAISLWPFWPTLYIMHLLTPGRDSQPYNVHAS